MDGAIRVENPPEGGNGDNGKHLIEPAPLVDVMFDQLEYLTSHTGRDCPRGCPDCARLEQIKKLLLVPFESQDLPESPKGVAA